ncbi:DNA-directed DNA polymerase II large subunit [Haloarchaeobius sp. HME9146]|uniref:DNA-directed DNA polymerase II large subunit n=1 Tax=Haloarchaeobius sp. HME9146 TaxID=2978732 RepID=UPI0021BDFE59|nr:DNA-directed DNA polymerase II large subunit [Haloarchaeobius sp. HME9146]MCT9094794.1 DNA-directed DNA polymerase II large subunit [Haloarchaeobius sp. HME9146]
MREEDERYFERIESRLDEAFELAERAKQRGGDPQPEVEIPTARDMADRVENILGIEGVAERVRELEGEMSREEAALELVTDFVEGEVGDYETREGKIEGAVRTAVALLTEGVVAAPIEGIDRVELLQNDDGTEFVNVYYAGPIRSAGGTAQALSVLVADYARALLDIDEFKARTEEVERYAEEIGLYDKETGLQYSPKDKETKFIAEHMPIMLDGEATGDEEVSGYRDLERVDTNSARGGMCLVLAEGIALKAPKIQRYTKNLDEVDWPWLQDLIDGTYYDDDHGKEDDESEDEDEESADGDDAGQDGESEQPEPAGPSGPPRVEPATKYLRDLIAGRPVFGHPCSAGGFRLRYGRSRNHGFATAGVHPATMHLVDDFLATGTQIKTERPGKAAGVVPVDSIEGPTVRLANGDVRRIDDPEEALEVRNGVEKIIDAGEYLVNFGEFVENNHPLAPSSYTVEWWRQDLAATECNVQALDDSPHVDLADPSAEEALDWADAYDAPLHPKYTYLWHDIGVEQFAELADAVADGFVEDGTLHIPQTDELSETAEHVLLQHTQTDEELLVRDWVPFVRSLGLTRDLEKPWELDDLSPEARQWDGGDNAVKAVNEVAPFEVQERAPTRIGTRMGRPEKSESRDLSPAVHTLFPVGEAGGSQRSVAEAAKFAPDMRSTPGVIEAQVGDRECTQCGEHSFKVRCPECDARTEPHYWCPSCEQELEPDEAGRVYCDRCERDGTSVDVTEIDIKAEYWDALDAVGERENAFQILKGAKGLMSANKTPEPMEKGVLRAKHGVTSFKDGTVRYDMTDLPVTSVRPAELDATADQFRGLGYEEDIHGEPLRHDDQLVELKVQDIVLSDGAAEHMLKTADFVDDLLESYYGVEPFYEMDEREELIGELVFGMAPHTSAATVGRVVGFTSAAVGYAHPYFHAAKRRNCFHPETKVWFEDESGETHYDEIQSFVEERLDPETADEDDFGTLVQELDGDVFVPSVDDDGNVVRKPVEAVSKHVAPDHMVHIETRLGRELTVTPDHEVLCWDSGGVVRVEARDLDGGESLIITNDTPEVASAESLAADGGLTELDTVESAGPVAGETDHVYCLTVADTHSLFANGVAAAQCDGDEDCVMLLLDGLLNFSKSFLPDKRGGKMDAPLVMSSRIDPSEIDDEAHNMDIMWEYPREFYEATREMADPDDVEDIMKIAEETLGTDREYTEFAHTHDTTNIHLGPALSAYKTLGSMQDKMDAQLLLSRKLRSVDETDVAERIIEGHFLPDLIGNLRAFSRQETRCLDCGEKYRRMPLTGDCRECGGRVNLTVHQGSVNKYMQTAINVADDFGCRNYTKQRLEKLEKALNSIFENDKNKQSGIADFM